MSVQISYKRQVVLGLMFLLVILAGIEIISRVVLDQRDSCNQSLPMSGLYEHLTVGQIKKICQDYQSIIQYPLPFAHYEPNQKTDTVTINSHGFRGEDFEKEKTNDSEYRIFMVGGSAMYGVYATSDGTTIPGYLQQLYNEFTVDHNIRVINGGANTHESFAETHLIKNKILGFNPDLIIVLDGWSKTYAMTGWRLGWGVWPEKLVDHLFKFCVNNHSCVNAAIQYGAISALDGPDDSINSMVRKFILRKNLMVDGLRKIKGIICNESEGGFFIFPNIKGTGMNGEEFAERCLNEAGVALIPGTAFGKFAVDNVRINFTTSEENISNALEKINNMLG